jgi:hypothetical protein
MGLFSPPKDRRPSQAQMRRYKMRKARNTIRKRVKRRAYSLFASKKAYSKRYGPSNRRPRRRSSPGYKRFWPNL